MRILTCLIVALACLNACRPKNADQQNTTGDSTAAVIQTAPYLSLKGTLAGQPVTMHLASFEKDRYQGWYFYDKVGEPIQLEGQRQDDGRIRLSESFTDMDSLAFTGSFAADGAFTGTWAGNGKTHPFRLEKDTAGIIRFTTASYKDTLDLLPGREHTPQGSFAADIVWPVAGADSATLNFIRNVIAPGYNAKETPAAFLREEAKGFFKEYGDLRGDVDTSALKERSFSWSWDNYSCTNVVLNKWPLLVLETFSSSFTGGAHPNHGTGFRLLDLSMRKMLKPSDVFKVGYQKAMSAALDKAFRKQYNIPAGEPLDQQYLFEKVIMPNDNFYLTPKGAVFSYTPYEIGPYAVGQITLFVPFTDIKGIVKEAYLQ